MREVLKKLWKGMLLVTFMVVCLPQVAEATEIVDVTTTGLTIDDTTLESTYKAGSGTISWKPAIVDGEGNVTSPAKMILNNATIEAEEGLVVEYGTDVTVEVLGTNQINCADGLAFGIASVDDYINVTITGNGKLAMKTNGPDGAFGMIMGANVCVTGGVNVSMLESGIVVNNITVDNAQWSCDGLLVVMGELHIKSGIIDTEGTYIGTMADGDAIIDKGATLNAGFIALYGELQNAGELNAVVSTDEASNIMTVYGDVVLDDDGASKYYIALGSTSIVALSAGATLTVPEGTGLDLSEKELTFATDSSLVVEGEVKLPAGTTAEDIAKMNITGDGAVVVVGASDTEEKIYTTDGKELNAVASPDFTNVGTEGGQTAAKGDGYTWDADSKTLTLSGAYIDGSLNLPSGSKIVVTGINIMTGEVTVDGTVSDAFTLSGEGKLNTASKKYVSHIYKEPTFNWTETKDGYTAKATFVCQGSEDTQTVDAKVILEKKEATCTEDGVITYTAKVTFENKEYVETKEVAIPKVEHTWDEGVVSKDSTTTEKGEMTYTCTACKEQKVEAIELLEVGMLIKDSKATYVVTKAGVTGGTVEFVQPAKKSVTTLKIPATIKVSGVTYKVTSIAAKACKGYTKLKTVTIGNNVKTIGKEAFSGCKNLKTIKLGKNVTTIGDKAFYNCVKITSITIPSKVSKIGKQTFYKCKKLKKIIIKTSRLTKSKVGKNAFKGIKSDATIKVPKKKVKTYTQMLRARGVGKKVTIKK